MKLSISALSFLFLTNAFLGLPSYAVMYGAEVDSNDPIAMMTVAILGEGGSICSGTLVAQDLVLTAKHCFQGKESEPDSFKISFGVNALLSETEVHVVTKIKVLEDIGSNQPMDLAIAKFDGTLPDGYTPIRTLMQDSFPHSGQLVVIAGYGFNQTDPTSTGIGILRKKELKIYEDPEFDLNYVIKQFEGGFCNGDSGGPAYLFDQGQYYLIGVNTTITTGMAGDLRGVSGSFNLDWTHRCQGLGSGFRIDRNQDRILNAIREIDAD